MTAGAWSGSVFSGRENQRLGAEEWAGADRKLGHSSPEGHGEVG